MALFPCTCGAGHDVGAWDSPVQHAASCPSFPKPATAEPPEWKGEDKIVVGERVRIAGSGAKLDGEWEITAVVQSEPGTPDEIIDRVTDALSDFIERRKAKRFRNVPSTPEEQAADIAKRTAAKAAEIRRSSPLTRAMLTPITFTAKLGERT